MQKKSYNNLFWRISGVFFLLMIVVGLAYMYITARYSNLYFEEVNQRLNRSTAEDIVSHSSPFTDGKVNNKAMELMFDRLMNINPSLEVYLLDNQGKILSFYAPVKKIVLASVNLEPVKQFISSNGTVYLHGDDPRHPENQKVFSAAPVYEKGILQGYIYVVLASEEYAAVSKNLAGNYLLQVGSRAMILTLLITLLAGLLIIRFITGNFSKILQVMQKFRNGDLNARVEPSSKGDFKELGVVFNEMADILTQNIEKLKEVENLRRELIANVSHDLRTPIAIIHGYVETLQMKAHTLTPAERDRYLGMIQESTLNLEKLVSELFELSKLEANQVKAKKEPFFISELVSDICNKYQVLARNKNISIHTTLSKELPPVFADVYLIERVMQNLLDNAMKYSDSGGEIMIKTSKHEQEVQIIVADKGIGIPEKEREQIFNRYYTAGNFTDLKNSSGLGLAIVKKILDLHNSTLILKSEVNTGSSFVFQLPVYRKN